MRANAEARVSMPLSWDDFVACDPRDFTLRTVPAIYAARGDAHAAIDDHPGRLDTLLELADRQEREGAPDAPWPPHFAKGPGEAARVAPSRAARSRATTSSAPPGARKKGARTSRLPVITIAQAKLKPDALAGLERWKARHADLVPLLAPEDILVDTNRGRATAWYRIRINLKNVPPAQRPPPEEPDPNYDPKTEYAGMFESEPAGE